MKVDSASFTHRCVGNQCERRKSSERFTEEHPGVLSCTTRADALSDCQQSGCVNDLSVQVLHVNAPVDIVRDDLADCKFRSVRCKLCPRVRPGAHRCPYIDQNHA